MYDSESSDPSSSNADQRGRPHARRTRSACSSLSVDPVIRIEARIPLGARGPRSGPRIGTRFLLPRAT